MRVIIAGSRNLTMTNMRDIEEAIAESGFEITEVVCGGATGADSLGEIWASRNNVPVHKAEPFWRKYGKSAGPIRNYYMAEYAQALILVWDGKSKGSRNMLGTMLLQNKPIHTRIVVPGRYGEVDQNHI